MDLRASSITADILNVLSDCKLHRMQEIADKVEVSRQTVQKHIQSLSYRYPIETFVGGRDTGGVKLDKRYVQNGKILSNDKLQIISKALKLLQNSDANVDKNLLFELIKDFSPVKEEGEKYESKIL